MARAVRTPKAGGPSTVGAVDLAELTLLKQTFQKVESRVAQIEKVLAEMQATMESLQRCYPLSESPGVEFAWTTARSWTSVVTGTATHGTTRFRCRLTKIHSGSMRGAWVWALSQGLQDRPMAVQVRGHAKSLGAAKLRATSALADLLRVEA